ncbi:MAG: glycosyltransferase family 2 protein [Oryzomonas sp.]|uniref:glycosyltransferase family 2 protein n=1 Tax=Oryzomonas sp. TaxID=2855186 RepID=UPI00284C7771|nr:glycosyltransferase family 2 protein [Oryzomonas sp.]MDR3580677.1 glycosyltransferase family 2 protein [Oryzomonas sp.]
MSPKVSVIIPVYNAERYLPECLDSLIRQTLQDIEIICVDDASTDGSGDILAGYAAMDPRVRVVSSAVNSRQGAARNLGLHEASAPYIGFVDADDFVSPAYFENLYQAIIRHDADIVITLYRHVGERGEDLRPQGKNPIKSFFRPDCPPPASGHDWDRVLGRGWEQNRDFSGKLQRLACVNHSMIMNRLYRKSLVDQVRFPEQIRFEDTPFIVEATHRAARVFTTPEGGYFYRRHPASTTATWDFPKFMEAFAAHKVLDSYVEQAVMTDEERKAYRSMVTGNYLHYAKNLVRKVRWLTPVQLEQVQAVIPANVYSHLHKRLVRKRLRLVAQIGFVLFLVAGLILWIEKST